MSAVLRHAIQDDGLVRVTLSRSTAPVTALITEREAKRFAWAILADLDPDEAKKAAPRVLAPKGDAVRCFYRGSIPLAMIAELSNGPATAGELAAALQVKPGIIASRANAAIKRGWVKRLDGQTGRGHRARYGLTAAGREAFGGIQP